MEPDQAAEAEHPREPKLLIAVAIILISNFAWRVLVPAHDYPLRTEQVLTMAFDLMLIVALIGLRLRVAKFTALYWSALVCGVGLFVIRLKGDASWWTGHLIYSLT